jgi:hypothetical protein
MCRLKLQMLEKNSFATLVVLPGRGALSEHYFRGGESAQQQPIANGVLRVPLREKSADGRILEWIEVEIQLRTRPCDCYARRILTRTG